MIQINSLKRHIEKLGTDEKQKNERTNERTHERKKSCIEAAPPKNITILNKNKKMYLELNPTKLAQKAQNNINSKQNKHQKFVV